MDLQLEGKRALVTASTAGIGRAIAEALVREDAHVVVNGRTRERVEATIDQLGRESHGAHIAGVAADLGSSEGCDTVIEQFPELDILVNNLGIFEPKPFENITDEDWFRVFEVNVMSGVRLSRHYLRGMKSRGWGRILFISSESAVQIPAEMIHYGVTKTAQVAVARGLAETTAGTAVTVNTILPGPTASEGVGEFVGRLASGTKTGREQVEREFFTTMRPTSLLRRFEQPAEVAALVAFVCSPRASAINGAALRVDGGVIRSIL